MFTTFFINEREASARLKIFFSTVSAAIVSRARFVHYYALFALPRPPYDLEALTSNITKAKLSAIFPSESVNTVARSAFMPDGLLECFKSRMDRSVFNNSIRCYPRPHSVPFGAPILASSCHSCGCAGGASPTPSTCAVRASKTRRCSRSRTF